MMMFPSAARKPLPQISLVLRSSLVSGLAVLALAMIRSKKPGLAPKRLMFRTARFSWNAALGLLVALTAANVHAELPLQVSDIKRSEPVSYAKEIVPLLKRNCLACHHAKESEGGLNLESIEAILKGGDSGPGVVPKDAVASLLMTRATGAEDPLMPPDDNSVGAKPLSPEELGLIKLWIEQGAAGGDEMASKPIEWQPIPKSIRTIYAMDVSADGRWVATGRGNQVVLYDLLSKTEVGRLVDPALSEKSGTEVADIDLIQSIAFAPDSDLIATGGFRTVKLWRKSQARVTTTKTPLSVAGGLIATNADRTSVAMVNAIGDIEIWNVSDATRQHTLAGQVDRITGLAWAGDQVVCCDESGRLAVWQASTGKSLATVQAKTPLHGLAVTADGSTVAAISDLRKPALWRVKSDKDSKTVLEPLALAAATPLEDVTAVQVTASPTPLLIVASETGGVLLINLSDGKLVRKIDHGAAVDALALSSEGTQLATGGRDGKTRLWTLADGKAITTLEGDRRGRIWLARALADSGRQKATVARLTAHTAVLEKSVVKENESLKKATEERDKATTALAAEEKKRVDAAAIVTATEAVIAKAKSESEKSAAAIAVSKKSMAAAKAVSDKTAVDLKTKTDLLAKANNAVTLAQQEIDAAAKAMSVAKAERDKVTKEVADRKAAIAKATAEASKSQQAIDAATKVIADAKVLTEKSTKELEAQKKAAEATEAAKKKGEANLAKRQQACDTGTLAQKRVVAAVPANVAAISVEAHRQNVLDHHLTSIQKRAADPTNAVVAVAFSGDNNRVTTAHEGGFTRVYRIADGMALFSFRSSGDDSPVAGVVFVAGDSLCAYRESGQSEVWSLQENWTLERTIGTNDDSPISDRVTALDFRPDGLTVAVGSGPPSRSGEVQIYSTHSGELVRDFGQIHSDTVLAVRFSPDGRSLASSAADKTVRLLDIASGQVTRSLEGHTHHVLSLAWQDDGQTIASASADQNVKIWNVETGEQRRTIGGFPKEITAIAFVEKSSQVITSCADGLLRLHDAGNGKSLRSFNASGDFLFALTVTPDGKTLLAGGQSGSVRVWSISDGKLVHEWK